MPRGRRRAPSGRLVRTRRPLVEPPNRFERMSPIEEASKSKLPKPPKPPPGPGAGREGPRAAVVLLALLGVAQHVMGLGDLLEASLGRLVVGVGVGVIFAGQLAVGLLDLIRARPLIDPEGLVVVRSRSHCLPRLARHDHSGRPDDALTQPVAVLVDLDDLAAPGSADARRSRGDRLVQGGVEVLAQRAVGVDPRALSAPASSARTRRTPSSSGSSLAAAPSARSRLSSAGSSSLARPAMPRSCATAASRATRLR